MNKKIDILLFLGKNKCKKLIYNKYLLIYIIILVWVIKFINFIITIIYLYAILLIKIYNFILNLILTTER